MPTSAAQRVREGDGEGGGGRGGGGHDNDLVSRGQHDHHERVRGGMGKGGGGEGVKYRMLHIPGILDCTYHLHVSVSVCSRF